MFQTIKRILIRSFDKQIRKSMNRLYPNIEEIKSANLDFTANVEVESSIGKNALLYAPYHISDSSVGDYTYVAMNSYISQTTIGRFCSIGPNLICGWGIHPTNGISTSPMFYSTMKQNGMTLSTTCKTEERKPIVIGNDVFIGANVTILDGVTICDGAVIGAGAVVSKDIPPYAIAVGSPIRIIRYRFNQDTIEKLIRVQWWNFPNSQLLDVEKYFFDVNEFLNKHKI